MLVDIKYLFKKCSQPPRTTLQILHTVHPPRRSRSRNGTYCNRFIINIQPSDLHVLFPSLHRHHRRHANAFKHADPHNNHATPGKLKDSLVRNSEWLICATEIHVIIVAKKPCPQLLLNLHYRLHHLPWCLLHARIHVAQKPPVKHIDMCHVTFHKTKDAIAMVVVAIRLAACCLKKRKNLSI